MAWNEPGGNGNKDPWGGGNRGDNQGPPDLDEILANLQKKFSGLFGGKGGGSRSTASGSGGGLGIGLVVALIFILWMATGFYKVEEAERGVVLRFGAHVDTTEKGLHWHWPKPVESVEKVNVAERRQVPYKATVLTQDENIIDLQGTLQYKIDNAEKFLFNVRNPETSLNHAIESAIRLSVGQSKMDFIITEGRNEIAFRIQRTVQDIVDQYGTGISIIEVNIQDVNPPQAVRQAFQDVIQAREDKQRAINEAEAYRNEVLPKARGAAARILEEADAYEKEVVARAEGEAERFTKLLKEYNKAPQVTRDRLYLDMMESVLNNSSKVMVDVKGGNNLLYLPLDKLMQRSEENAQASQGLSQTQQRELLKEVNRLRSQPTTTNTRSREVR
ncbi:MAG: FtsH protease activity modulator HflK [Gammaproteobacteria bacterium]|nr:FtsH protease activity modulator HflK [Gammaproteobacteria bacterium]